MKERFITVGRGMGKSTGKFTERISLRAGRQMGMSMSSWDVMFKEVGDKK